MEKKNVRIVSINSKYIHSSLAPWCLFAGMKEFSTADTNCKVIEGTINENINNVYDRIVKENPHIIGFCCYIWNINFVYELIERIKNNNPNVIIILGGPEVSYNQENVLNSNANVDYILSGEGEKSFPALIDALVLSKSLDNVSGISFRENSKVTSLPPAIFEGELSPYTEEYFEALNGRIAYIETSRGCPYSCAFCLSGRCKGVRFFNMETAKADIVKLSNSGTKTVKFVDRTFNADKKRAKEIWRFIIDNRGKTINSDVCFHFEIAGDILDKEMIEILQSAPSGSMQLEIGLQSFNEKTLSYINRKTNTDVLKHNITELTKNQNIHIHIDLIAGLPYEDMASFKDSFNVAYSLNSNMLQLGFLKLLYGAPMREDRDKFPCEFKNNPPYEVTKTPWMSEDDLKKLSLIEDVVERTYNSGRFRNTLDFVIQSTGLSPFDVFQKISETISPNTEKISLDDYTNMLFHSMAEIFDIDKDELRDSMVIDRITSNASGKMPPSLKVEDERLKKIKHSLSLLPEYKQKKNVKRGLAILYTKNEVIFSDYDVKNEVTGAYKVTYLPLSFFDFQ